MSFRNVPASVRQRLLDRARSDGRPFSELLQYYAIERFLYRLSRSAYAGCFILKGGVMLRAWRSPEFRPTMDIDMLGRTSNQEGNIIAQMREIMGVEVESDGITFDPDSIQTERITEDAEYEGIRVRFRGMLDSARVSMQVDIGFGDIVYPGPEESDLPAMLDHPSPRLLCYSPESVIAEKFETMVKRGVLNSRMKDFYDIWLLSRQFDFEGEKLAEAIRLTFQRRGTMLPGEVAAFDQAFILSKQLQWTAFRKRLQQDHVPARFLDIVRTVEAFLSPLVTMLSQDDLQPKTWAASGPWS
jgi:predicted nucleotidyltransferase component of viral defense system